VVRSRRPYSRSYRAVPLSAMARDAHSAAVQGLQGLVAMHCGFMRLPPTVSVYLRRRVAAGSSSWVWLPVFW